MADQITDRQNEIDANYESFAVLLPDLMKKYPGKFVVMRHREAKEIFDTSRDALVHASKTYPDGLFSVQEITQKAVDLGWFSYAVLPHKV